MSLFGDIGNFVSNVASDVSHIVSDVAGEAGNLAGGLAGSGLLSGVAGMLFPELGLATSMLNLVAPLLGNAVNGAAQQLTQTAGMPKFIQDDIANIVKQVVSQFTQPSSPGCDQHVQQQCGNQASSFIDQFAQGLSQNASQQMGGGKAKSWLEALADALGDQLNKQAKAVTDASNAVTGSGKDDPKSMTTLQTESQRMSFLMNAVDQVIKTLGEALATASRKQ
jgi:flagellar hook-basal body complex protein FliE